jgi:hypothetical protein
MKLQESSIYWLSTVLNIMPAIKTRDYLLASEGGICGKFNLSNCCLQIDDKGKVMEETTDQMRKTAHIPFQTWTG